MKDEKTNRGLFVVLEGIDGSGTTTQIKLVSNKLRRNNFNVLCTREPSDGTIGRLIRCILSGQIESDKSNSAMALLFAADRMDHVNRIIRPALRRHDVVLCDRYYYSSFAYQSIDSESESFARYVNKYAEIPDLLLILDVELEEAQNRMSTRMRRKDYTEEKSIQKRVRKWYRNFANENNGGKTSIEMINSNDDPEVVSSKIYNEITKRKCE